MKIDKPMMAYGTEVKASDLQAAWDRWVRILPQKAYKLECILCEKMPSIECGAAPMRLADRLIQRGRKAGDVRYFDGMWWTND